MLFVGNASGAVELCFTAVSDGQASGGSYSYATATGEAGRGGERKCPLTIGTAWLALWRQRH